MPKDATFTKPDKSKFTKTECEIHDICEKIKNLKVQQEYQKHELQVHKNTLQTTNSANTKTEEIKKIGMIDQKLVELAKDISTQEKKLDKLKLDVLKYKKQCEEASSYFDYEVNQANECLKDICNTLQQNTNLDTITGHSEQIDSGAPSTSTSYTSSPEEPSAPYASASIYPPLENPPPYDSLLPQENNQLPENSNSTPQATHTTFAFSIGQIPVVGKLFDPFFHKE
ncbi:hypothetical protein NOVO_00010 [Rickettsiales bacterium Ac37b]|nr:hypothetical protein NOVO_00010 [Rickettsiales bacterium Ac37b]